MRQAEMYKNKISDEQETQTSQARVAVEVGVASTVEPFCDLRVGSKARHKVRDKGDKNVCWVTGCQYLLDGSLVFCEYNNNKLKLLNQKHKLQSSLPLPSSPWDVAVISQNEVVVTLSRSKKLQVVNVKGGMTCGRTIDTDCECHGVAVHNNHLYVTCCDQDFTGYRVLVLDMQGHRVRTLGVTSDGSSLLPTPGIITVDDQGRVYVSDWNNHTVTCLSATGDTVYTYSDQYLQRPRGLLVDSRQNVYVCGQVSNNIQVISRDGRKLKTLLSSTDGLVYPCSLSYRSSDRTLVVGMWDDEILSYRLQ